MHAGALKVNHVLRCTMRVPLTLKHTLGTSLVIRYIKSYTIKYQLMNQNDEIDNGGVNHFSCELLRLSVHLYHTFLPTFNDTEKDYVVAERLLSCSSTSKKPITNDWRSPTTTPQHHRLLIKESSSSSSTRHH